jgi:predicted HicB family RNase H-like nuclease
MTEKTLRKPKKNSHKTIKKLSKTCKVPTKNPQKTIKKSLEKRFKKSANSVKNPLKANAKM